MRQGEPGGPFRWSVWRKIDGYEVEWGSGHHVCGDSCPPTTSEVVRVSLALVIYQRHLPVL